MLIKYPRAIFFYTSFLQGINSEKKAGQLLLIILNTYNTVPMAVSQIPKAVESSTLRLDRGLYCI